MIQLNKNNTIFAIATRYENGNNSKNKNSNTLYSLIKLRLVSLIVAIAFIIGVATAKRGDLFLLSNFFTTMQHRVKNLQNAKYSNITANVCTNEIGTKINDFLFVQPPSTTVEHLLLLHQHFINANN